MEDITMIELFKNLVALTDKKTLNMILPIYGKSKDDIISWLEKQGEIIDEYEDKLDRCACESFDKGYKAALEKQGEQKPTLPTWNEEDERMINSIIKNLDESEWFDIYQADWLRSLKERMKGE